MSYIASGKVFDDITYYVIRRIFNSNLWHSCVSVTLKLD